MVLVSAENKVVEMVVWLYERVQYFIMKLYENF